MHRRHRRVPAFRMLADIQQRTVADEWEPRASNGGPREWLAGRRPALRADLPAGRVWDFDWGQIRLIDPYEPRAVPAPVGHEKHDVGLAAGR
ncbi:hypothetical protein HBB16_08095 [Pseudonocardia sp. MCCB 268]|nr:hypothetical protein [Pseudonocardia cytotoxica]